MQTRDKCLGFRVIHVVYSATLLFLTTNNAHVLECSVSQFSNLISELQVSKPCRHLSQKKINICLPNNTDMPSLFTCCHRIVTVLCLVCLLVAVVDGMQGSSNYQLRTTSHAKSSVMAYPSSIVIRVVHRVL